MTHWPLTFTMNLTRAWICLYTCGLEPEVREQRRAELMSDLWEHEQTSRRENQHPLITAVAILLRCALGIPADLSWRFEERAARDRSAPEIVVGRQTMGMFTSQKPLAIITLLLAISFVGISIQNFLGLGPASQDLLAGVILAALGAMLVFGLWLNTRSPKLGGIVLILSAAPALALWWTIVLPLLALSVFAIWVRRTYRSGGTHSDGGTALHSPPGAS